MPDFDNTPLGAELKDAIRRRDGDAITMVVEVFIDMVRDNDAHEPEALEVIGMLQRGRRCDDVVNVAEALIARDGWASAETYRRYAQCLIERGALSGADCILHRVLAGSPGTEIDELRGLTGRVAKQRYVNFHNDDRLVEAIRAYGDAYATPTSDKLWHGANLLALLRRAERENVPVPSGYPTAPNLARQLLNILDQHPPSLRTVWQRTTEIEVRLAQGDVDAAAELALTLAATDNANAFEMNSMHRQLAEVWELKPDHKVMQALDTSALLMGGRAETGGVEVPVPQSDELEKLLNNKQPAEYDTYIRGMEVARAVCMITDVYGFPLGSGFVVPAKELSPTLDPDFVLVTNSHVISDVPGVGALTSGRALAMFQALPNVDENGAQRDAAHRPAGARHEGIFVGDLRTLWSSDPSELDTTILALDTPDELKTQPIRAASAAPDPAEEDPFVYVIGHPAGKPLSLSIRGNELLAVNDTYLHYMAPTEPGSSGSPVFDKRWNLVGLHHSGSFEKARLDNPDEHYPANEAINLTAIKAALEN